MCVCVCVCGGGGGGGIYSTSEHTATLRTTMFVGKPFLLIYVFCR